MNTAVSPGPKARVAGVFYLLTIVTGILAFALTGHEPAAKAANVLATACYVVVILLLYSLFKPVNRSVSLIAALFGLAGCAVGLLRSMGVGFPPVHPLAFFGFYCLLIGGLIYRSRFLPRLLGILMAFAGVGWLTFLSPPFARSLSPFNMAPGMLGESVLAVWLLARGVDVARWKERAAMRIAT